MNAHSSPFRPARPGGFTLVELLVVIAIIASLLAMAGSMLNNGDGGDATRMAAKELRGMVEQAQARAVASGNQTAVLIHNKWDSSPTATNERYLRFVIVAERVNTETNPSNPPKYVWQALGNGSFLSAGAYYWPLSGKAYNTPFALGTGETMGSMGSASSKTPADWIGILFNSQGIPVAPSDTLDENPIFLIATGPVDTDGKLEVEDPKQKKNKLLTEGFMLQRSNGRVIAIESAADQLDLVAP